MRRLRQFQRCGGSTCRSDVTGPNRTLAAKSHVAAQRLHSGPRETGAVLIRLVLDRRKNFLQKEPMKIGYARVSKEDQNLDLQIEALTEAGCDRIITYQAQSGAKAAETRAGFSKAMELLGPADLLVVWKLDRVGRSIAELIHLLKLFGDRGIEFCSLTDGIDTTTAGGRLLFHIMGALAEFERDLVQERTKAGLSAAKKRGKRLGRPPALPPEQITHAKTVIETKRETVTGMAEILGVNRSTLQRAMNREARVSV